MSAGDAQEYRVGSFVLLPQLYAPFLLRNSYILTYALEFLNVRLSLTGTRCLERLLISGARCVNSLSSGRYEVCLKNLRILHFSVVKVG